VSTNPGERLFALTPALPYLRATCLVRAVTAAFVAYSGGPRSCFNAPATPTRPRGPHSGSARESSLPAGPAPRLQNRNLCPNSATTPAN